MAENLKKSGIRKFFCWNCPTYGWSEDEGGDGSSLSACSQCSLALYCSRECQREHWEKVHKKHCKYLAGKKINPISKHSASDCPKCKIEEEVTSEAIIQVDNPVYPCHIEYSYRDTKKEVMQEVIKDKFGDTRQVPIFVSVGEMTGKFISKQDKTLSILQQIFLKISAVHPEPFKTNSLSGQILGCLTHLRGIVWSQSLTSNLEEEIDSNAEIEIFHLGKNLLNSLLVNVVKFHPTMICFEEQDGIYKWWSTFIFFLNIFFQANYFYRVLSSLQFLSSETLEKSEGQLELNDFVVNNNFLMTWERLLAAVTDKMIPYEDLLGIYCEGQLYRECGHCSTKIQVETFTPGYLATDMLGEGADFSLILGISSVLGTFTKNQCAVTYGPRLHFTCGEVLCDGQIAGAVFRNRLLLSAEALALTERFVANRCDCCYKVTERAHRCSRCKTKIYCSEDCQHTDWKVHKICCQKSFESEDQQRRKKKGDGSKVKRVGLRRMGKFQGMVERKGVSEGADLVNTFTNLVSKNGFEAGFKAMGAVMEEANFGGLSEEGVKNMRLMTGLMKNYPKL